MIPMYVMPSSLAYLVPLKKSSCVNTAPTFPPPPVNPETNPRDLRIGRGVRRWEDPSIDRGQKTRVPSGDEGDDPEGEAAGGLDEDREDQHHEDGEAEGAGLSEPDAENAADTLHHPPAPEPSSHPEPVRQGIRQEPASGSGEEVREPEASGDDPRRPQVQVEPVVEVLGDDVVDRQLHPEAVAVAERRYPGAVVPDGDREHSGEAVLGLLAALQQVAEVAVRQVLPQDHDGQGGGGLHDAGDEEGDAPGGELGAADGLDHVEHQRHDQLRGAAAEVAPAGGDSVGDAHLRRVEHGAHPELARHEARQGEPREEPHQEEGEGRVDAGGEVDGRSGDENERRRRQTGAHQVAGAAHHQPGEDGAGDGGYPGVADVGGGEVQVVADDGEKRRRGEGGHEAGEEGKPGQVESAHVRRREGE